MYDGTIDITPEVSMIWQMLRKRDLATEDQLQEVLEESRNTGQDFEEVLYNYQIITEDQLLQITAEELNTQFVELHVSSIDREVTKCISGDIARTYSVIPIMEDEDTVTLATDKPFDTKLFDELHFVVNKDCHLVVARPKDIMEGLEAFYPEGGSNVSDVINELVEEHKLVTGKDLSNATDAELVAAANETPIIKFVNVILHQAIRDKASDIHFEPFADEFRIRYRIDGDLYEMTPPPKHLAIPVISRIKVMSNMNISERRIPQDGRIELRINRNPVDLRVSTLPTRYGESVVLRILDRTVVNLDLDALGMSKQIVSDIRHMISRPNGIFLVTGPTGSGKTTTLYSGIKELNKVEDKLLTVEDPVEYDIEGIMQVPVHEAVGMTFANALRAFLRQDPDRILVGEIRDKETADIAIQAALTGHLVLSTLHTNDAAGAVTRLIDMGIEPFLIASTVIGVLAQRLIRRCCPNCKQPYDPTDEELEPFGVTREQLNGQKFYRGMGCDFCNGSGYKKRVGIFELMHISPDIQSMINRRCPTQEIKDKAMEQGMRTLRQDGLMHVLNGVTSAKEVIQFTFG
ncbi:MAG: Flp pilus assembly complex ATPase component TadA [Lentisphaeria bacterium]|nr:Flp pilus assembly complex ATPase component TadA [Lentisphaeria bacterium]